MGGSGGADAVRMMNRQQRAHQQRQADRRDRRKSSRFSSNETLVGLGVVEACFSCGVERDAAELLRTSEGAACEGCFARVEDERAERLTRRRHRAWAVASVAAQGACWTLIALGTLLPLDTAIFEHLIVLVLGSIAAGFALVQVTAVLRAGQVPSALALLAGVPSAGLLLFTLVGRAVSY